MPALTFSLDVATATADAPAPTETTGPGLSLPTPVATALAAAPDLVLTISAAYYGFTLPVPTPVVCLALDMALALVSGTEVPGDLFAVPIRLTGLSGSGFVNLDGATQESGEDAALSPTVFSTTGSRSLWLRWTAPANGTLTFTVDDSSTTGYRLAIIEASFWDDPALVVDAEQEADGVNAPSVSIAVASGHSYYFYIATVTGSSGTFPTNLHYTWALDTAATFDAVMTIEPKTYDRAPTSITVSVLNMDSEESVEFQVVGNPAILATIASDEFGAILGVSISMGLPLVAGTYTLQAHGTSSGTTVTDTFTLLNDPMERPAAPVADIAVVPPTQVGIQRWVFQDAMPAGLGTLIFPANPTKASSPFGERPLTAVRTVAQDGTVLIWEGAPVAQSMQFSGYTDDTAFIAAMEAFLACNRRFYWIDHRSRVWTVAMTLFGEDRRTKSPETSTEFPQAMNYTATLQIFAGPM